MAEDIFKYAPISEWNGEIVDFGMPSTDGDIRLTEICLAADACLEAASNAIALSFTDSSFAKARTPAVQKIVRTLFGEDTGINIVTFQAVSDDGSVHFMSPMVSAAMELLGKNWEYEIVSSKMDIGIYPTFIYSYPDPNGEAGEKVVRNSTWHQRQVLNPFAVGQGIIGNRPITGNWDQDGEPYWELNWDTIQFGRCSDNVQTSEGACTSTILGGVCREMQAGRGYCTDSNGNEYTNYRNNESGCLNIPATWSSSVGTPPVTMKKDDGHCSNPSYDGQYQNCVSYGNEWYGRGWVEANIDYYGDYYCTYYNGSYPQGRCFYSWNNLDSQTWVAWGNSSTTESGCKDYAVNQYKYLYWMWIPPGNTWINQYAVWRPSYDGNHTDIHGNSDFIQGTVDSWKHFNIKTEDNHRKYPINHVPSQTGTNLRVYHSDTNSSWGNGTEVGRSTIPLWITNTFDWSDNDNTYDYCMSGSTPIEQWSSPFGYTDGVACLASGTCTGDRNPSYYHNNQVDCETAEGNNGYICSGGGHTDQSSCVNDSYCTDGQWTNQSSCVNEGTCWLTININGVLYTFHWPNGDNNPGYCNAMGGSFSSAGNSWNNYNYSWYQANTFTSDNYTWDTITPDIEVEIPIAPDYFWKMQFPPHTFVDSTDSRPLDEEGYTTNYTGAYTHLQSQIRWKPPQRSYSDHQRTYPRPTKFRIYRAPAFYQNYQINTDYTEEIWKLAGEVITKNDSGYHYFYDSREDMVKEGLKEFQHAQYAITAVWENWNWKLGYTINLYSSMSGPGNGASDSKWDIRHGQSWSAVVGNIMYEGICSNSNYTATGEDSCVGNGACLPSNTHSGYNNDEAACIAAGGTWSSSNYTWTPGQWTGTQNSSADLDNVENATPMGGYPQRKSAVKYTSSVGNYRTYRASGYIRAPVTGTYYFQIRGDDGAYMWLGSNGETVSTLVSNRTYYNYKAAVPGLHSSRYNNYLETATQLTEGHVYPILAYGGNHTGDFYFEIRIFYPDGAWNDGGAGVGEWKYVPIDIMPEDMDPGMHGNGQTVEGHWAATSVPSWYENYP
jgi:hypothetical protein